MAKHNYSQYSNKKKSKNPDPSATEVKMEAEPVVEPVVEQAVEQAIKPVETVTPQKTIEGVVVNCAKLNVRAKPSVDGDIVCVLNVASEIEIDIDNSTYDWFKICTASGVEGYCMRKFVEACL